MLNECQNGLLAHLSVYRCLLSVHIMLNMDAQNKENDKTLVKPPSLYTSY